MAKLWRSYARWRRAGLPVYSRAVKEETGRDIDYLQARAMKLSVLGRYIEERIMIETEWPSVKEHNLDSF